MAGDSRKYLLFTLQGRPFAFDLAEVAEVVESPVLWPVPVVPPCYAGAMNFHGTIVAVMDLNTFFGYSGAPPVEKAVVLDNRIAALAFSVESIIRITPFMQSDIRPASGDDPFATGILDLPEGKVTLLDAPAIAAHAAETIND